MLRRFLVAAVLGSAFFVFAPQALADDDTRPRGGTPNPVQKYEQKEVKRAWDRPDTGSESSTSLMVSKFTRGLLNILTGWIEIPKQIARTAKEDGAGKGATIGFLKGIGMAVARTAAGVLEAGLFFAPFPEDYKPILEPALVFD